MRPPGTVLVLTAVVIVSLLCPAARADEADPDVIRDHLDRGMLRTVRPELDAYRQARPDDPEGLELEARCREAEGNLLGAYEIAGKLADLDPADREHWRFSGRLAFEVGRELFAAGKPPDACRAWFADSEARFRRLQQLDPQDPEVIWRLGRAKEWLGDGAIAEQFYDLQITEFPRLADGYRCRGELYLTRAAREQDPTSEKALKLRAEGFAVLDRGLSTAGEDALLRFAYGEALERIGEQERAVECYLAAVRADPEFSRAWNRLSELADPERVILPAAIEAVGNRPSAADPAWWAGYLTNQRRPRRGEKPFTRNEEALGYLLPALERHSDHEGLYAQAFLAAQVLYGDDPKKAPSPKIGTDAFIRIHDAYRWSGDAANNLGFFYREAKKYKLSIKWYLLACERAPDNQDILNDTGLIYLFHFPRERQKGLPYFLQTLLLVTEGDQKPERGYWDALENLCKHYWEVDRQPEKVIEYARMRYQTTKGVKPYNMSQLAANHAKLAKAALGD